MIEHLGLAFLLGAVTAVVGIYAGANLRTVKRYGWAGLDFGLCLVDVVRPTGKHARRWWA